MMYIKPNDIEEYIIKKLNELLDLNEKPIENYESLMYYGLNSLKTILLIVDIEEKFEINFNDDELLYENFSNVQAIKRLIEQKKRVHD